MKCLSVLAATLCAIFPSLALAASLSCNVPDSVWTLPRSGAQLLALPALQPCWNALRGGGVVVLQHRAEEGARVNAAELQDWAIAFGVDSKRISLNEVKLTSSAVTLIVNN